MTVTMYQDEPRRRAVWTFKVEPTVPPTVEMFGAWYPLSYDTPTKTGVLLLCGSLVDPPTPGCVVVPEDCLPRVNIDGEFFTDEWVRVRSR